MSDVLTRVDEERRAFNEAELRQTERGRLEDVVLDAAKAERVAAKAYEEKFVVQAWQRAAETRVAREKAVDALTAFEAEQGIGEKDIE